MEKEFIPYEQALALKELGFDEPCFANYNIEGILQPIMLIEKQNTNSYFASGGYFEEVCTAPTFSQAFRWFRDKGFYTDIFVDDNKSFGYMRSKFIKEGRVDSPIQRGYSSYEEAQLECLKELINKYEARR